MKFLKITFLIIILYLVGNYFYYRNYLILERSDFSNVSEIDTIEAYPQKGIYILGLVRSGFLGNFSYGLGIIKSDINSPSNSIKYEVNRASKSFQITKEYFAFVKEFENTDHGWFYVKNNKLETLPSIKKLEDSIKLYRSADISISDHSGHIELFRNGKIVEKLNYGNLIIKNNRINFDSLDYHMYELSKNSLIKVSANPNELLKQPDGLYFIPPPGYGVISKYDKEDVLNSIESVFISKPFFTKIRIKPTL